MSNMTIGIIISLSESVRAAEFFDAGLFEGKSSLKIFSFICRRYLLLSAL